MKRIYALAGIAALAAIAQCDERHFAYTYDWYTPAQFEKEIELGYTGFRGGGFFGTLEFEYGITDRWVVAPYLLFEKEGGVTKFQGCRLEQRYRFAEPALNKILPALYLEINKENDEPYEVEGKLIASYHPTWDWIVSTNLVLEQAVKRGERPELGYSLGVARIYERFTVGAEAFGNWKENEHFWGPSLGFRGNAHTKIVGTAGIPYAGGGTPQFRILVEKEF